MSKKFILATLVLLSVLTISLFMTTAQAANFDRNNEKFVAYSMVGKMDLRDVFYEAQHIYKPSLEEINQLTIIQEEEWLEMTITIGSNVYVLNDDFTYEGTATYMFNDVTEWTIVSPNPVLPLGLTAGMWPKTFGVEVMIVDYSITFLDSSGIDGTLNLRAVSNEGGFHINSLSGTDDLQNVQLKATRGVVGGAPIYTARHIGIVSGWPE